MFRTTGAPALLGGMVGRQVASLGNGKQFCGLLLTRWPSGIPPFPWSRGSSTHTPPSPPQRSWPLRDSRSSKRSSSGAGSSCRTGGGFLFRSSGFPVAKIFWSLRFSFSRSPVGPRCGLGKVGRAPPIPGACSLQGAWEHGRASANPPPPSLGRLCTGQVTVGRKVLKESRRELQNPHTGLPWWLSGKCGGLVAKSCLTLATPWTVARQAPLATGLFRQEYWSGLPFPSPGGLPDPGVEPSSPALQADS